ncbi:hypothetical protein SAMD00019534_067640 [Acytostelium subglobosum LB1]|uniref:hypothetical protein n=1 Tax=Acytostelium subglobosum LB1 TaxID=1410327 RepID=UPI000644C5E5|nr:hypothetical protein SAMD00019534_125280 [Acytostelium subglobosum LB1]XP_012753330.1 hypothetical protein SAMD00019534_067640 [Acytostelium subglobosum LB1]GAM23589.1 hypothetical protein SAMD00019534_067640 [Acytostelium subglobosum LB1]GAM29352.1 hypothetical protein SAMD00019534_125280 [Acytostelium subglobosum LB1]|eukprot:XP_012747706.1 hypothetical protein SAMD00019534_125280 [Acytostelium subglobosum LB1]
MQLKNILAILHTDDDDTAVTPEVKSNNQAISETIEAKMKYVEQNFSEMLQFAGGDGPSSPNHQSTATGAQSTTTTTTTTTTETQPTQHHDNAYAYVKTAMIPVGLAGLPLTEKKRSHLHHHHKSYGPPEIPPEEILFDPKVDHLGGGAYGKVYRATCRSKKVAVKVPKKQTLSESELKSFKHEVEIWKQIYHPNVVMCMGACTKPGKIMIVSELMQSDLEKIIHSDSPPPLYQRIKMAYDAALGMNWLHGICNILHRDLKLANLMIGKDNTVKITDFGFSQVLKSGTTTTDQRGPKGTALYMAPEVMQKKEFNEKADVYSFGLILYELATCEELFPEYTEIQPFSNAICNQRLRPTIPADLPKSLAALMQRCWDHDPSLRPSFSEVSSKMNEVLIDIAISGNPNAAAFWKNSFGTPDDVKWAEFAMKLSKATNVDIRDIDILSNLFVLSPTNEDTSSGVVNIERFELMTKWFGPFYSNGVGAAILQEMMALLKKLWFHFDISRDVSERRLRGRAENTFLIRLSLNDPVNTPLTISKIKNSKPTHKRVAREDEPPSAEYPLGCKFRVPIDGQDICFSSVIAIVDKLKSINNLGSECPHNEIKIPYVND